MPRYPSPSRVSYAFGPGPLPPGIKALIWTNVGMFLIQVLLPDLTIYLALAPVAVVERLFVWQPLTYMFLHDGVFHILFNMLMLWMFGTDLERAWGTRSFLRYYFVCGIGAAIVTLLLSVAPVGFARVLYYTPTVGASGAIYGVMLAYGLAYPNRPIFLYLLFPVPARIFVLIMGAIAFLSSISGGGGNIAHGAHLGGLLAGFLYLKVWRGHPLADLKYQYAKWRMSRMRRRFGVHQGGRNDDRSRWVH